MKLIKDFKIEEYNNKTYIIFPNGIYDIENNRLSSYYINYKEGNFDRINTTHKIEDILNSKIDIGAYLLKNILIFDKNSSIIYTNKLRDNLKLVNNIYCFLIIDTDIYPIILEYERVKLLIQYDNIDKKK